MRRIKKANRPRVRIKAADYNFAEEDLRPNYEEDYPWMAYSVHRRTRGMFCLTPFLDLIRQIEKGYLPCVGNYHFPLTCFSANYCFDDKTNRNPLLLDQETDRTMLIKKRLRLYENRGKYFHGSIPAQLSKTYSKIFAAILDDPDVDSVLLETQGGAIDGTWELTKQVISNQGTK